jgi:RNA polymerase sigma factor (sigma-70 family)
LSAEALTELLVARRADLVRFVERHGGTTLRFESADDLVQGIHVRALDRGRDFTWQGDKEALAWLYTLARGYLADRHEHWSALKRRPARLLRLTASGAETGDRGAVREPAGTQTGPSTYASRREQLELAVRALALLLPRDRDLVRWHTEGMSLDEQTHRLGVSYDAAERAHLRALERFKKAFQVVSRR